MVWEQVQGVAEVSLNPQGDVTADIVPLPKWLKSLNPVQPLQPYISNVLVNGTARRRGFASRLVNACERTARDWGYADVYLHVEADYRPARRLYEKLGYEVIKEDGRWEALLRGARLCYMGKRLP